MQCKGVYLLMMTKSEAGTTNESVRRLLLPRDGDVKRSGKIVSAKGTIMRMLLISPFPCIFRNSVTTLQANRGHYRAETYNDNDVLAGYDKNAWYMTDGDGPLD